MLIAGEDMKRLRGQSRALPTPPPTSKLLGQELWRLNRPNFFLNLCGKLGLMSDQIIISVMLGPAAIVPFSLTCRLPQIAQKILQNISKIRASLCPWLCA